MLNYLARRLGVYSPSQRGQINFTEFLKIIAWTVTVAAVTREFSYQCLPFVFRKYAWAAALSFTLFISFIHYLFKRSDTPHHP